MNAGLVFLSRPYFKTGKAKPPLLWWMAELSAKQLQERAARGVRRLQAVKP